MKRLSVLLVVFIIIGFFSGCKKDNDNKSTPGEGTQEYKGNSHVVIRYFDYNPYTGQDEFIEEKQYDFNSFVFVGPPKTCGGTTESNAFNLQINPDRISGADEEGHVDLISSQIFAVSTGYDLLQYWNYSLNGNQVSGVLQDNHTAEAAAGNIIWAWDDIAGIKMTMPFAMRNGATLNGTISDNAVSLTITGESTDTYRKFTCQINATRQ